MIKIALRNLSRQKRRTLLTVSILSFAILYYIFIAGILSGFELDSTKNLIELETAHIIIRSKNFVQETLNGRIKEPTKIIKKLKQTKFVKNYTERLKTYGFLDNGIDNYPVIIMGIKWDRDTFVYKMSKYANTGPGAGILIGEEIAKRFKVKKGDYLFINFRNQKGALISREMRINGILSTPSFYLNNLYVIMDLDTLNNIGEFNGEITEISLLTDNLRKTATYKSKISNILSGYKITTWQEEGKDFLEVSKTKKSFQFLFLLFIILIGIIGTTNTLLIAVFERIREIGTLKAMGMTDGEVKKMFMLEGLIMGIIGTLVGVILGVLINLYFVKHGINWSPLLPKDVNLAYRVSGVVKSSWDIQSIVISLIIGPLSTVVASLFPAKKAAKLLPQECLRWI